jgi:MOSC domain-containing protein YiiM
MDRVAGKVLSINISPGGVPKRPVAEGVVGDLGIAGDGHHDKIHHGGRDQALCIYSIERIEALRAEGHPVQPGSMGENLTLQGLDTAELKPGDRLAIGEIEVELTGYASPCRTISESFLDRGFSRVLQEGHPGDSRLYARVLRRGTLRPGDAVSVLD